MDNNSDVELDIDDEQMRSTSFSFVNGSLSVDREVIDSQSNSHPSNESSNIDSSNDVLSNDCEESDGVVQDTESNNPASLPIADSPEVVHHLPYFVMGSVGARRNAGSHHVQNGQNISNEEPVNCA